MVFFTSDLIKHVFYRVLTLDDHKRLWSPVIRKLTNRTNFYPFFSGSACANYIEGRFEVSLTIE